MPVNLIESWNRLEKVVIGMLHLPALPGAPACSDDLKKTRDLLLRDVELLSAGGVDGMMIENFGDVPFYPGRVPIYVATHMTALAMEVRRATDLPLGINVLRSVKRGRERETGTGAIFKKRD
jgi:predicted TIM-barrel enzyme